MKTSYIYTSMLRTSDIDKKPFSIKKMNKEKWKTGDYVAGKIISNSNTYKIELINGRMRSFMEGDLVIGALGERYATLDATGTWKEVTEDGKMNFLTHAGLFGKCTSKSAYVPNLIEIQYKGHIYSEEKFRNMNDYVPKVNHTKFNLPIVLVIGTSMSAGKTTSARIIINQLKRIGLKVVAGKLTGASRYRDILSMKDVGADYIFDFVDMGLPSSIYPHKEFKIKLLKLLSRISYLNADIGVIELGASPLEPYNGDIAFEALKNHIKCIVLCASDPYAVYGVMKSFNLIPDIVSGIATNTYAGSELIEKLCKVRALNLINPNSTLELRNILSKKLNINF